MQGVECCMITKILKKIVSYITVIISVGYFVYITLHAPVDIYQMMILSLLILIATTFILDNIDDDKKWKDIEKKLKDTISAVSPSQIQVFENSADWVDAMELIIKSGQHTVDTASLDAETRSKASGRRTRIWSHITDCCKNSNITFRHIVRIRKNNFENLLERIIAGTSKQNTYFAYYELPQDFSFPTFGIIDNHYVSTRSPYHEGEIPHYIIIENKEVATYFNRYFRELWDNGKKIRKIEDLESIYSLFENGFSNEEKKEIALKMKKIKDKGIIEDV